MGSTRLDENSMGHRLRNAIIKFGELNARYVEAPIPIATIIKKYFMKGEYRKLREAYSAIRQE